MHFTRTPLKNKKLVKYGTNKMGQYYSNERVPIKNYNTTPIATRIDKNMTNLNVNEQATNKNLNQFIQPVLEPVVLEPETDLNIFNYNYDNININSGLAEKTKKMEDDYEEMNLAFNKNLNTDNNILSYSCSAEIDMNINIGLAEKIELAFNKNLNTDNNILSYSCSTEIDMNINIGLAEKIELAFNKFLNTDNNILSYSCSTEIDMDVNIGLAEKIEEIELISQINTDINIFNYNYDNTNVNVELVEKIQPFEEMKLTTNKDDSSDINVFNYKYSTEIDMTMNAVQVEKTLEVDLALVSEINIFNYNYDNTNVNAGLAEKTKKYEEDYDEMKLLLNNTDTNTTMNLKTDDKNFNSFLSIVTETNNDFMDDTDDDYINKPYTKTEIASILNILQLTNVTIENVYQEKYGPDINATGIGDFIRGSFFLMQFCEENKLLFNINMLNHPISRFLEIYQNKQPSHYKNINKFDIVNFNPGILDDNILINIHDHTINNDFMYFLKDQSVHNKKIYTYIISYPTIIIAEEHKTYMRHLLKPNKYLSLLVDEQLTKLKLSEKEFSIIHVRYGDNYLIKNEADINVNHLNTIGKTIDNLGSTNKILLISDNMIIKNVLTTKFPHIKTHYNKITHTGEGVKIDTNKLKNTMVDFYLFSRAKNVFAFSVYKHGTGFSKWATETYSVPYICRFLQ